MVKLHSIQIIQDPAGSIANDRYIGLMWGGLFYLLSSDNNSHEGNTMQNIMGNKPQVKLSYNYPQSWNDLLHQDQTADVAIIRAKTGIFSIETLDVHLAP
jgi:hypothetical protein